MKKNKKLKQSAISRNFVVTIGLIYSLLIIITAVLFNYITSENVDVLKKTLSANTESTLIDKVENIAEQINARKATSLNSVKETLKYHCKETNDFLYVIVYSMTADENYFRVRDTIQISKEVDLNIKKHAIVQEKKDTNYLKKGKFSAVVDPIIYSSHNKNWTNVYYPIRVKYPNTRGTVNSVLQFLVSADRTYIAIQEYTASMSRIRTLLIIVTLILVIAVIAATLIFTHNYSLLVKNLSHYMTEAAKGNLELSLNPISDDELNHLAESFNSLIEEMKDMKDIKDREGDESISFGDLFKTGVGYLKEDKFEDAIAIFKTITTLNPNGYGSYFNLGIAYAKTKRYQVSLLMFDQALKLNPANELTLKYIEKVKGLQASHG